MNFHELCKQTWISCRQHKLRSFLALFGIMWGTLSVVLLMALGSGFYQHNKASMHKIANGQIFIRAGMTSKPYHGKPSGQLIQIKTRDVFTLAQAIPSIRMLSPMLSFATAQTTLTANHRQITATAEGVSPDFATISDLDINTGGRFINAIDVKERNPVIFLSDHMKRVLFPHNNPMHKIVRVKGIPFVVIGYETPQQQGGAHWKNDLGFIPYSTYQKIWGDQDVSEILALAKTPALIDTTKQQIRQALATRFHFSPHDTQAIMIPDLSKIVHFFDWFFWGMKTFLLFCGLLTLTVGGIGVANILFLIVSERTAEIGLRMALGAPDQSILWQVIIEALMLVFTGGIAGILIAAGIVTLLQHLPLPDWIGQPTLSPIAMVVSFMILAIVGLMAGYFPAKKAAHLEPAVAIAGG